MTTDFRPGNVTEADRQDLVNAMLILHDEIAHEIERPRMDPARLMRLQSAAVNQCLVGISALLVTPQRHASDGSEDDKQLRLFPEGPNGSRSA